MKVVVLGAGTMGTVHSRSYARMPNVTLLGIVDPRIDVAENLARETGTKAFPSFQAFLGEEDPDVVDICVPTPFHRGYVEQAASLGKHVICEKPLGRTLEDAEASVAACKRAGVRLMVGQVVRFFPEYQRIRSLVLNGDIGEVGVVRTFRGGAFPTAWNDWYANEKMSGTLLVDLLIHDFDFLRWCFGDVTRVYAKNLIFQEGNRVDHAIVSLRFANGVMAHAEGTWALPSGFQTAIEVAGSEGLLDHKSTDSAPVRVSKRQTASGKPVVEVPASPLLESPYYRELEHFMDCLASGKPSLIEPEDAIEALKISLAAFQSARTGEVVTMAHHDKGSVHQ